MDVPQEELCGYHSLSPDWPFQGLIEFQNVTMRYKPSLPAALHDITFTIEGGTQVREHMKPDIGLLRNLQFITITGLEVMFPLVSLLNTYAFRLELLEEQVPENLAY